MDFHSTWTTKFLKDLNFWEVDPDLRGSAQAVATVGQSREQFVLSTKVMIDSNNGTTLCVIAQPIHVGY